MSGNADAANRELLPWYGALEFRTLAETISASLFVTSSDGLAVYTNSAFQRYSGMSPAQLLGDGFLQVLHPDETADAIELWHEAQNKPSQVEIERRLRRADGEFRWHKISGTPVCDARGNVLRWMGVCTDIQELRSAIDAAQDATELLKVVGQSTDAIVFAKDAQGDLVFANEAALRVLERDADQVIGQNVSALASAREDAETIARNDAEVLRSGQLLVAEERWTSSEGPQYVYRSTKGPWRRADGTTGIVGISVDLTDERRAEDRLAQARYDLRATIDALPCLVWLADNQGEIVVRNAIWGSYSTLPARHKGDANFADMIDPCQLADFDAAWHHATVHRELFQYQAGLRDRFSDRFVMHDILAVPISDRIGRPNGWVGSAVRSLQALPLS
jgi:PAS domain S-box-containing protein